jgi:hypothetical protein
MKTLLKIFFVFALLAEALEANAQDVNTRTRQVRFYPVRQSSDTAATAGNSGRMWYDFSSNKFRVNRNGTNGTLGEGGSGGSFWSLSGNSQLIDNTVEIRRNTGNPFLFINTTVTGLLSPNGLNAYNISDTDFSIGGPFTGSNATIVGNSTNISFQKGSTTWLRINNSGIEFNLASSATGDIWYRNSSALVTRLAKGTEGTLLRAGASVPAYSTFTIPNTIAALSIFAANSANVLTAITPAAGQSIRVNAGGTAWEAYTPGGGGSFTNGAANNELIKSNGTNGVSSGIFAEVLAGGLTTTFGINGSTAGQFRDFIAAGSEANIAFRFLPKGSGNIILQSAQQITSSAPATWFTNSGYSIELRPADRMIRFSKTSTGAKQNLIIGGAGISSENDADSLVISGGDAYDLSGNGNGGDVILKGGAGNGSGVDGNVYTKYAGYNINLALFEPVQETGTSFTFDYSHLSKTVVTTNAVDVDATVPVLQVGYITKVRQYGAGIVTLLAGTNVVLQGKTSTTGPGDSITIHAYITDSGDTIYSCE